MFEKLTKEVKSLLEDDVSGHDFHHVLRVIENALLINETEQQDSSLVYLTALLHDVFDPKFYQGCTDVDLSELLEKSDVSIDTGDLLMDLKNFGFSRDNSTLSPIGKIVSDADRLDAMGAIGIARCFAYGAYKGQPIVNPEFPIDEFSNQRPSVYHFYDKLLKLEGLMYTQKGKELARERHAFMVEYLKQFKKETGLN